MAKYLVAVADSVFPTLDPAREVLSSIGAEIQLSPEPTTDAIMAIAKDADGVLVTYAKITAEMIRQMTKCRVISRFGIGVDNAFDETSGNVMYGPGNYVLTDKVASATGIIANIITKVVRESAMRHEQSA